MAESASPSPIDLAERRRNLRRQRRVRNLQALWRSFAVVGLTAGACWLMGQPVWLLRSPEQIQVEGNTFLSDQAIQRLLPVEYPQSLLAIKPQHLVARLQSQAPIEAAVVTRHLFPPHLSVWVEERQPVAVTLPSRDRPGAAAQKPGLLDSTGRWMPQDSFTSFAPEFSLPALTVRGFRPRYQSQWSSLYSVLQQSPIPISEVDWRDPSNLILQTALGTVYLGTYDAQRIQKQLSTLSRLQTLIESDAAPAVDYIDLTDPDRPAIKVHDSPSAPKILPEES